MGTQLRWGIAGVGMIAHDFLTAMGTLPPEQHKVVAIAGKDIERAHRLATLHKIATAYEGYESLARDESIGTLYDFESSLAVPRTNLWKKNNKYPFINRINSEENIHLNTYQACMTSKKIIAFLSKSSIISRSLFISFIIFSNF